MQANFDALHANTVAINDLGTAPDGIGLGRRQHARSVQANDGGQTCDHEHGFDGFCHVVSLLNLGPDVTPTCQLALGQIHH